MNKDNKNLKLLSGICLYLQIFTLRHSAIYFDQINNIMIKAGILGGGQLGRMLLQVAANFPVETYVMENDENCPSAHLCNHFIKGDITNFADVYHFGKSVDVLTIEIENVNIAALELLEKEGLPVYPNSNSLKIIKNKISQKQFYKENGIATSDFLITENLEELKNNSHFLPAVHKLASGGYDGKGVKIINEIVEIENGFNHPSVLEKKVNIKKELSVIVAVDKNKNHCVFPVIEMIFDNKLNLLNYQIAPAQTDDQINNVAISLALKTILLLNSPGIFAVELFVDNDNNVSVNETAPRVHNSGHHTIEANFCSQFEMLWRIILNYPLGNPKSIMPSLLINVIGSDGFSGTPVYEGLADVLEIENVYCHIYGKTETRPGRKMGHINILAQNVSELKDKAGRIKNLLKVKSK